jgi:hypothetical protein
MTYENLQVYGAKASVGGKNTFDSNIYFYKMVMGKSLFFRWKVVSPYEIKKYYEMNEYKEEC